ncbi:MRPL4 [Candida oxycetoniae]|uniref:Large ribosomal subunit protein uL29m n=1 Tax=Candida oxycetoniae TaxID=497107 RepID=A0AAI9WXF4_9ASCO|nr:MRPL4 [Candida oxycetoniae]KAI3404182.2 MRPL4 [Candida oxycetoniae]
MSFASVRFFSRSSIRSASTRKLRFTNLSKVKLREPIVPTVENFKVSPDHPLWQFFPQGNATNSAIREPDELDLNSREWTSAELRQKSFEDLHKLWYIILKERNILAREVRVGESIGMADARQFDLLDEKLVKSQKRIKQVLSERHIAFERVEASPDVIAERQEYLDGFAKRYLEAATGAESEEMDKKLDRLQYAIFGIEPELNLETLKDDIDVNFIKGVEYSSNLKAKRYVKTNLGEESLLPLNGPMEELPFFLHDIEEAVEQVKELRLSGNSRTLYKSEVIPFLIKAIGKHLESYE